MTRLRESASNQNPDLGYSRNLLALPVPKSIHSPRQKSLLLLLRKCRLDKGLTQEGVAEKLGVPQSFVSKYESGERRLDVLELEKVCQALGMKLSEFVAMHEGGRR